MHEVIICEKPSSAEKIAKALSPSAKKKTYNKKVKYWELKRDSKDIPIIEAANAVYKIVSDQIALSPDDLAKEAAKQLGFSRLGTNLTTLMEAAVELNKEAGYLTVAENGNITLNKTEN